MPSFIQAKNAIEDWARPDRRASVFVTQDGEAHAVATVMPAGKAVAGPSQTVRFKFTDPNAVTYATTRIRGIIDGFDD